MGLVLLLACCSSFLLVDGLRAPSSVLAPVLIHSVPPRVPCIPAGSGRAGALRMQSSMGEAGLNDAELGNTYWAAWNEEQGITESGFPAGDDIVEKDLKRMFNLNDADDGISENEIDDLQLMFKLRKELGDDDFKRIFGDLRINGPPLL
ncbi:hypothetical protein AB1Y20_010093 [Prymnesium parvum]|uniref:Uncharacterized protein n=1 Tax=Prymnesium parvum TaxID=97485 RepID=A0AB34K6F9_PRYPA